MVPSQDKSDTELDRSNSLQPSVRRPWHAPQFILTDVSTTYAQGNGTTDNAGAAPSSS
jgi:hypothetical protein